MGAVQTAERTIIPPGRALSPRELAATAAAVAARPELWRPLMDCDPDERRYESLYVDEHLGIWVITWMPGHDTGFHDHDESCGGVAVALGSIREERPIWGAEPRMIEPSVGESFCFDSTEIHRMLNVSDAPAVTIHAYSVPIQRMGVYRVDGQGRTLRRAVAWDEPLAPSSFEGPRRGSTNAGRR